MTKRTAPAPTDDFCSCEIAFTGMDPACRACRPARVAPVLDVEVPAAALAAAYRVTNYPVLRVIYRGYGVTAIRGTAAEIEGFGVEVARAIAAAHPGSAFLAAKLRLVLSRIEVALTVPEPR